MIRRYDFPLVPIVRPFPFRSLKSRWIQKVNEIQLHLLARFGIKGARIVGISTSGNTVVKLNRNYLLGTRGTILELPKDRAIFKWVIHHGGYAISESLFLAENLKKVILNENRVALIDIGANSGLVTLQTLNCLHSLPTCFLFEPIPKHVSAIESNLETLHKEVDLKIIVGALSDREETRTIYTQGTNHGNTSLLSSVVKAKGRIETKVRCLDTAKYFNNYLQGFNYYVIKSDTQGYEPTILSRIPTIIWESCQAAVIEVWSLSNIDKNEIDVFLSNCLSFTWRKWEGQGVNLTLEQIGKFWTSQSGDSRNLYLWKEIQ
jgi:FkbM family methyltransferase